MDIKELRFEDLDPKSFISEQVDDIAGTVGDGLAINALSGGSGFFRCYDVGT